MAKKIIEMPMPDLVKAKMVSFGIKEEDIDTQSAMLVSLYKQALEGNVSAIKEMNRMLNTVEEKQEEKVRDISKEVAKEEKRIRESLSKLSKDVLEANKDFIHQLAFQSVQLKDLSDDIARNGVKEKYYNGANQWGYKDRTEVKTYNNMFKNYQSAMKQLNDLLVTKATVYTDDFDSFGEENE